MKFKETPIKLEKGQTVTSLYHSPFDYNLVYLICLAKTGLKVRVILDDIDNIGIDRTDALSEYSYKEKYFLSKTERANIRSLSLTVPKHLMANLAFPSLKELDEKIGIAKLKTDLGYKDTVDHWIKDTTRELGTYSLVGPDKAFAYSTIDNNFIDALNFAKANIKNILSRFTPNNDSATQFIDWLFDNKITKNETISDYYAKILNKIIEKFELKDSVTVERMSDVSLQEKNKLVLKELKENDDLQKLYSEALNIDSKKAVSDFPFYAIAKKDGERLLPIQKYFDDPDNYIIAPKVLMLNNFENLILPYHAIDKKNIYARELMYTSNKINCNQIFCDDNWLDHISSFGLTVNLDDVESKIYDRPAVALSELIMERNLIEQSYKDWVIKSTIRAFKQAKYPLIFLALLQDKFFYKNIPDFYKLNTE